jgi:L-fuconolactonase
VTELVDTHVHVWDLDGGPFAVTYPWLTDGPLHRTYRLAEIESTMSATGVTAVVLVQASDSLAETDELLRVASEASVPVAVVGWLPLADPGATAREIARRSTSRLVGVRHLIHDEPDTTWMLRPDVSEGLTVLAAAGLTFDAVAERPDLLEQVPQVAARHPDLTIVVDHIGKPPVRSGWGSTAARRWAGLLADVAECPTVVAKLSGLATVSAPDWSVEDWRPFVEHAFECFGSQRLMLGSDWPVSTLNGTYAGVMNALLAVLDALPPRDRDRVAALTARAVYRV